MNTVRPLFVSTYPPEECGLATFTRDSADAVDWRRASRCPRWRRSRRRASLSYDDPRVVHVIDNAARTRTAWPRRWPTTARATW